MCGIAGLVGPSEVAPNYWVSLLGHRGPDGNGLFEALNITLVHTRLAILDLSANGHQPMSTTDGRYVITFNGEIYNHTALRAALQLRGCTFRSTSDTETFLYGFAEYGTDIFRQLNGIFACAIFDTHTRELILARDQFGVKPLYYYTHAGKFLFASELKAIVSYPGIDKSLDYTALSHYLHYLYAPGEQTPLLRVRKLLPGHYLRLCVDQPSTISLTSFYTLPFHGKYSQDSDHELVMQLDTHLKNAVNRQLQADVPLGFYLSGGLDSSAIVALAAQLRPREELTCYTICTASAQKGYEGFDNDLPYARRVAKHLGVKLIEVEAEADSMRDFANVIYHLDEPLADTAPINVLNICRQARANGHTVLLGGTAGDDLFSGYRRHQALSMEGILGRLPATIGRFTSTIVNALPGHHPQLRRFQKLVEGLGKPQAHRLADYYSWLPYPLNRSLFTPAVQTQLADQHPRHKLLDALPQIAGEKSLLNQLLFWETAYYLPDHNLNYTDKLSMAVGVETRVPFLDLDLVNFATQLPPSIKMKGRETKYILKKAMEPYLPKDIIYRTKTGFGTPLRSWLMAGELNGLFEQYLATDVLNRRGLFDPKAVHQLIADTKKRQIDAIYSIWGLMAIECWCQQFIDTPVHSALTY